MKYFYSAATGGFYCDKIHGEDMPEDAKEVPDDLYEACRGQQIVADASGLPQLYVAPPPSIEQRKAALLAAVDAHLNAAARAKGYDSIINASLRAALPASPFHTEGVAFGTWMDAVYAKCYEVLADVQSGAVVEPNEAQLIAMLPALQLPE